MTLCSRCAIVASALVAVAGGLAEVVIVATLPVSP
jgi:hypothetical protein